MDIIEQIEIKNFRSFGNRKEESYRISKCNSLNIISGANDTGKSNILRALNLFFNKRTDLNSFLNFERDFYKKADNDSKEIKEELITIKIWFSNKKNKNKNKNKNKIYLPEKFWVSRKWKKTSEFSQYDQFSSIEKSFEKEKKSNFDFFTELDTNNKVILKSIYRASLLKQLTDFLSSIQFHYVPAIKDSSYFSHLYGELQQTLWKTKNSVVEEKKNAFEKSIQEETDILMSEFKNSINSKDNQLINPVFQLPSDLINLFKALVVQTGEVDLTLRGDGFQAKLIPEILNFIAVKELSFTTTSIKSSYKSKKYFIWGFEEPENSYEYKNAQVLAEKFRDFYSSNAQIFITTHSFNFLSLKGEYVSTYRVWKDNTTLRSKITAIKFKDGKVTTDINGFSQDWELLQEELGIFYLNNELHELYEDKIRQVELFKSKVKKYDKPLLYSEGYNYKYLQKAKDFFRADLDIEIVDGGGKNELQKIFQLFAKSNFNRFNVFFVFDCDAKKEFELCKKNKTKFILPYIFPKNQKNTISEFKSGIENMFDADIFESPNESKLFSVTETTQDGTTISRVRKPKKRDIEKFILEERNNENDFENFIPFFEYMDSIFNPK